MDANSIKIIVLGAIIIFVCAAIVGSIGRWTHLKEYEACIPHHSPAECRE